MIFYLKRGTARQPAQLRVTCSTDKDMLDSRCWFQIGRFVHRIAWLLVYNEIDEEGSNPNLPKYRPVLWAQRTEQRGVEGECGAQVLRFESWEADAWIVAPFASCAVRFTQAFRWHARTFVPSDCRDIAHMGTLSVVNSIVAHMISRNVNICWDNWGYW